MDRFFNNEKLEKQVVELPKIQSKDQLVDILIKAISNQMFTEFLHKLGMRDIYASTWGGLLKLFFNYDCTLTAPNFSISKWWHRNAKSSPFFSTLKFYFYSGWNLLFFLILDFLCYLTTNTSFHEFRMYNAWHSIKGSFQINKL